MADFVVGPWEVDPTLVGKFDTSAVVIDGPEALRVELPTELADAAARHNAIDGFGSARWADDIELQHIVIRFADADTASAAARDLASALAARTVPGGPVVAAIVPGHPDTAAFANPVDEEDGRQVTYVRAITAHGPYVFSQRAMAADGVDEAARLIAGMLDRQPARIDRFQTTPPALLGTLAVDPTGLLARTLAPDAADATAAVPGSYGTHGALHFQDDPVQSGQAFGKYGVGTVAYGQAAIYQGRDVGAASLLRDHLFEEYAPFGDEATAVSGVPGSRCAGLTFPTTGNFRGYCLAATGPYVVEAEGATLIDAQQRLAAQFLLLTR